jgi:hypothetical protein
MTINPASTRVFSIATIIRRAYQLAGLMNASESTADPAWTAKAEMAADLLDMGLKRMQASSIVEKHVLRTSIAITGGTATYAVASNIIAMLGTAMFAETGDAIENPVIPMDRDAYQVITDKTTQGHPSRYWFDRYSQQISLWPVPDANGSLVVQAHRLIADGDLTQYDVELERHWTEYLVTYLAYRLSQANSLPAERVGMFKLEATDLLKEAQGYSRASEPFNLTCTHRTGWSR